MDFYWREDIIIKTNFIFYILHSKLIFRHEWSNILKYSAIYPNLNPPQKKINLTTRVPIKFLSKKNRFWQPTITNSISPKNIQRKSTPRRLIRGTFLFKLVDAGSSGLPPPLHSGRDKSEGRGVLPISIEQGTPQTREILQSWPWSIPPPSPPPPPPPRCVFFLPCLSPRIYSSSPPSTPSFLPSLENPAQVFSSRDKAWKRWAGITRPSPSGLESVDLSRCFVSWAGCCIVGCWFGVQVFLAVTRIID